ncbi:hypothetical protein FHETE_2272 [Fusarium heterosporum]|uniref:Protein SERAC1 n=1 Tax=Fusarium heterosporum TaxID=42747 RepID=A0A8H5WYX3_FUSHE|nr:hypothetical protein FHETE_2272 [Fusarium heterosporum]
MDVKKKGPVFRVTGLPAERPDKELNTAMRGVITDNLANEERPQLEFTTTIVPSCNDARQKVALVEFYGKAPRFLSKLAANPLENWQVEMGNCDISFDQHFFGFTQLYTPNPDAPVTAEYRSSIIAITGLDGHAYGSWRGKGNLGRMWLRDFLSKDLPSCRTMIYGYNSKLSSHGIDTIMDYGLGLIEELKKIRNSDELRKRPLIFIAHSFGGIILAHCLVKATQTTKDDHPTIAFLHKATYGMLLFGIPHKGLMVDDIQKMLAKESDHPRNVLLQQIKEKSDLLAYQLADFKNLIRDRKIDEESKRWGRTGSFVTAVDKDSALLQLPDHMEEKIPLGSDHSMIIKFDDKNNQGYTSARAKLERFEKDAPKVVSARFPSSALTSESSLPSIVTESPGSSTIESIATEASNSAESLMSETVTSTTIAATTTDLTTTLSTIATSAETTPVTAETSEDTTALTATLTLSETTPAEATTATSTAPAEPTGFFIVAGQGDALGKKLETSNSIGGPVIFNADRPGVLEPRRFVLDEATGQLQREDMSLCAVFNPYQKNQATITQCNTENHSGGTSFLNCGQLAAAGSTLRCSAVKLDCVQIGPSGQSCTEVVEPDDDWNGQFYIDTLEGESFLSIGADNLGGRYSPVDLFVGFVIIDS